MRRNRLRGVLWGVRWWFKETDYGCLVCVAFLSWGFVLAHWAGVRERVIGPCLPFIEIIYQVNMSSRVHTSPDSYLLQSHHIGVDL